MNESQEDYTTYVVQMVDSEQSNGSEPDKIMMPQSDIMNADISNNQTVYLNRKCDQSRPKPTHRELKMGYHPNSVNLFDSSSGYWSEADCHRLLRIYLKHMRAVSFMRPTTAMWHVIMKEFDHKKRFNVAQIKAKLHRLKLAAKSIEVSERRGKTPWPYLSAVTELLRLEEAAKARQTPAPVQSQGRGTMTWSDSDTFILIEAYLKHLRKLLTAKSGQEKRIVWSSIANVVKRPRYHVSFKIQSLKYTWRRYRYLSADACPWVYTEKMREIENAEQDITNELKRFPIRGTVRAPSDSAPVDKTKWQRDETTNLLDAYKNHLLQLRSTGEVSTKKAAYSEIAKELGVTPMSVQIKLVSMRAHWKSYRKRSNTRQSPWVHLAMMNTIMKLENSVWISLDDSQSAEESQTSDCDEPKNQIQSEKQENAILSFINQLAMDRQRRHDERMAVKRKMIEILERLMPN